MMIAHEKKNAAEEASKRKNIDHGIEPATDVIAPATTASICNRTNANTTSSSYRPASMATLQTRTLSPVIGRHDGKSFTARHLLQISPIPKARLHLVQMFVCFGDVPILAAGDEGEYEAEDDVDDCTLCEAPYPAFEQR